MMSSDAFVHMKQKLQELDDQISITSSTPHISQLPAAHLIPNGRDREPCNKPEIVRIGLNHGTLWYDTLYDDKYWCLLWLVKRSNETSLEKYYKDMEAMVDRAQKCYVEPVPAEPGEYVEMMLLDSCFIIHLFFIFDYQERINDSDPIYIKMLRDPNYFPSMQRDLIRIGNQLPFFVLDNFFEITGIGRGKPDHLITLAQNFFYSMGILTNHEEKFHNDNIQHLLDLVYRTFVGKMFSLTPFKFTELEFINYATELQEAGIKFKKKKKNILFDIKFKNGEMEIPPLRVADGTLCFLRNLMEYEKQFDFLIWRPVNDYAKFMQCLVNSSNDVKLLRCSGIIDNWLGNDEVIFNRLNMLGSEAEISCPFTYSELLENVNEHCRHRRNRWMANLRRNYFNSPWSLLSLFAAVILLLLTLTQTVFSILSYHHP